MHDILIVQNYYISIWTTINMSKGIQKMDLSVYNSELVIKKYWKQLYKNITLCGPTFVYFTHQWKVIYSSASVCIAIKWSI